MLNTRKWQGLFREERSEGQICSSCKICISTIHGGQAASPLDLKEGELMNKHIDEAQARSELADLGEIHSSGVLKSITHYLATKFKLLLNEEKSRKRLINPTFQN